MNRVDLRLKLMFSRRYRECVIVGEPKWVFSTGEGDASIIGVDPGEYYTLGFCNLVLNSGMPGPTCWNSLPPQLKSASLTLQQFCDRLKTVRTVLS